MAIEATCALKLCVERVIRTYTGYEMYRYFV